MIELRDWTIATIQLVLPLATHPQTPLVVGAFFGGLAISPCNDRIPWPVKIGRGLLIGSSSFIVVLMLQSLLGGLS